MTGEPRTGALPSCPPWCAVDHSWPIHREHARDLGLSSTAPVAGRPARTPEVPVPETTREYVTEIGYAAADTGPLQVLHSHMPAPEPLPEPEPEPELEASL